MPIVPDYWKEFENYKPDERAVEANRIAFDMRFSFTVEPSKNLPLLKTYRQLMLSVHNEKLRNAFQYYFQSFLQSADSVPFKPIREVKVSARLTPAEQETVNEIRERILDYIEPARKLFKQQTAKLGIPDQSEVE